MAENPINAYLADVEEPGRSTLDALRRTILDLLPTAQECISYGVPAFRHQGKLVAGFAAYKHHLSYLPHSGSVLASLDTERIRGYETSKGALRFGLDEELPRDLVKVLLQARLAEITDKS